MGAVAAILLLVCLLAAITGAPASAGKAGRSLSGKTKIRKVQVLSPTRGKERGSLLVWVRVDHAVVSPATGSGAASRASHRGQTLVSLDGERGTARLRAHRALDVASAQRVDHLEHGYRLRVSKGVARRIGASSSTQLHLEVRASQRLDLDGDGDPEARRSDAVSRDLRATRLGETVSPESGVYRFSGNAQGGVVDAFMTVQSDAVVSASIAYPPDCEVDITYNAPIDPQTGAFDFRRYGEKPDTFIALTGSFGNTSATAGGPSLGWSPDATCPLRGIGTGSKFFLS